MTYTLMLGFQILFTGLTADQCKNEYQNIINLWAFLEQQQIARACPAPETLSCIPEGISS